MFFTQNIISKLVLFSQSVRQYIFDFLTNISLLISSVLKAQYKPKFHLARHVASSPCILAWGKVVVTCCVALVGQHGTTRSSQRIPSVHVFSLLFVATQWLGLCAFDNIVICNTADAVCWENDNYNGKLYEYCTCALPLAKFSHNLI